MKRTETVEGRLCASGPRCDACGREVDDAQVDATRNMGRVVCPRCAWSEAMKRQTEAMKAIGSEKDPLVASRPSRNLSDPELDLFS